MRVPAEAAHLLQRHLDPTDQRIEVHDLAGFGRDLGRQLAGRGRHEHGAEAEHEYVAEGGTRTSLSVSYADFRYGKNTAGLCYPGRVPDGSAPGACDLAGERPVDAPPWQAWLGVEQPFQLAMRPASVRVDWNWTDRYNTSFSADPRLRQPRRDARIAAR